MPTLTRTNINRHFQRRTTLPEESDFFWKIEAGIVRTLTWTEAGEMIVLGIWGKGDIVGSSLSTIEPYEIECLTKTTVQPIPVSQLGDMTEELLQHLRHHEEFIKIVHNRSIELAIVRLLNWLASRFGQAVAGGHLIDLLLTHQEISEIVGTSRVTTTRIVGSLVERGIIQRHQRHFIVSLDRDPFWHYEI
ncbi:Crp/Fnr family transcriptional regulator [Chamaesiphon sp.]|uniref:Crp/Fnr family transcriptional regulator n=1 Tax=Chamaesiphon sp. TaxID=2814140 RepID=UPI003593A259